MKKYKQATKPFKKFTQLNQGDEEVFYKVGDDFYEIKEYSKAIEQYQKAIKINPSNALYHYNVGVSYSHMGKYNEAIKPFKRAIQLNREDDEVYNGLGDVYFALKEYSKSIEEYQKAIKINPSNSIYHYNVGISYYKMKRYKEAIKHYNKSIQLNQEDDEVYNRLGDVYYNLKEYSKSIEEYQKAIKINPSNPLYHYNVGISYYKMKRYKEAIKHYNKAIQLNQEDDNVYNRLGDVYYNLKEYSNSIKQYQNAIKINPSNPLYHYNMGISYSHMEKYNEAIESIKISIQLNGEDDEVYNGLGDVYYKLKEYSKAIEEYQNAIKINPSNPIYHYNMGISYSHMEKYNEAIESIKISIQLNGEDDEVYNGLGDVYYKLKEYSKAVEEYQNAIKINPSNPIYHCNMGVSYSHMEKYNEAIEPFNKAIQLSEEKDNVYNRLGDVYYNLKEYSKAIKQYQNAIKINPSNPIYHYNVGVSYSHMEKYNEAIESFKISIQLNREDDEVYNGLGDVYYKLKEYSKAVEEYQNAIKINSSNYLFYYNLGITYFEMKNYEQSILQFKKGIEINSQDDKLHNALANSLSRIDKANLEYQIDSNNLSNYNDNDCSEDKKEIDQSDGDGNTNLHKECFRSNVDQVINLLSKGASVHVYNKDGNSPLHLSLLSTLAIERIKNSKIQEERLKKIRLIIGKLIESGADLNITNKKFQTPLSLIVNLGFEKLRIEIGRIMFSNRGKISKDWIRGHLRSALSHYHGDFHHTSKDQDLLDLHVSFLTGNNVSKLMAEDIWIYIGHLHSLHGKFKKASQTMQKSFENFTISKALSFRIRVLFELLITIEKGILTEQSLPIPKITLFSLLFDELYFTLESLHVFQDQSLIQEEISCFDTTPLQLAHVLFLQKKIEGLKSEESYCYPTGFIGHAIYLNIERRLYNNEDSLIFRVDNLGGIEEGGRTYHHLYTDSKGNKRAFPATFCVSRDSFLKNNHDYLKGIASSKWNLKENSLGLLYDELKLLPNRVELDHKRVAKIFPSRRIQTVSNCSVKNWQVGMQIRWQSIDQLPSYSSSSSPHFLYRWFRQEEPRYLRTKYKRMAIDGISKHSNNNKDGSGSLLQSYKLSSNIQKFVESAVSKKQFNNNISGGWIIDHNEISIMNIVGEGGSGVIYLGKYHDTTVAVKQLHGDNLSSSDKKEFYEESKLAFNLHFKHVVQLFGVTKSAPYYIVMEYMAKGSLADYLVKEKKQLTWERKLKLALKTARGLAFLHEKEIIHRDMKSLNVLVGKNNEVKISDFGLAKVKQSRLSYISKSSVKSENSDHSDGKLGTVPWKAPELFKKGGKHTNASDVYSLGIVLWEISSCQLPFHDADDETQIIAHVSSGDRLPLDDNTPSYYNEIIEKCWAHNVSDRPTAFQVVQFLKEAKVKNIS